jgi:ankyrin repeat protein
LGRVLRELPETLDQAYGQTLDSIDKANPGHSHHLFQCLTAAVRPLRVEELAQVLAIDFGARVNSGWRMMDQQAKPVLSTCSRLISIDSSQVVQFSDFSVKEYLTSKRLADSSGDDSRHHITLQSAHMTLAQACLGVLLSLNDQSKRSSLGDFPFAKYAANHWGDHVRFKRVSFESRIRDTLEHFLRGDKPHWNAWHRFRDDDKRLSPSADVIPTPLFYAAFYGLSETVKRLIEKHPEHVNPRGHSAATPLYGALMGNQFDVAQLLYDYRANVNIQDSSGRTLLHVASQAPDHVVPASKILRWLLDHKANVHMQDEANKTPLHVAAAKGSPEIISMLISREAKIDAKDKDGRTPLHAAVGRQSLAAIQTLISHRADVNFRDKKGKTPLHLAVHLRQFHIAQELLGPKTRVSKEDEEGNTPLHVAAELEDPSIAHLLIRHGADVDARNKKHSTPLHVAVHHMRHPTVLALIDKKADINAKDHKGKTPLHVAHDRGHDDIAKVLLKYNAKPNILDSLGRVAYKGEKPDSHFSNIRVLIVDIPGPHGSPASSNRFLP